MQFIEKISIQLLLGLNVVLALFAAAWIADKIRPLKSDLELGLTGQKDAAGCWVHAAIFVIITGILFSIIYIGFGALSK